LLISVPRAGVDGIELSEPLKIEPLLNLLALLCNPVEAELVATQVARSLVQEGILSESDIQKTWPLIGNFGLQIWDLDGTAGRNSSVLYQGVAESIRYAWEISALMSFSADHLLERGLWLKRSVHQVYSQVQSGFAFFDDHMVFMNVNCCLEMAHLPAWMRSRSHFRLSNYGYDSSSIFVWTTAMLRDAIVWDLSGRYRGLTAELTVRRGITAEEQVDLSRLQFRHRDLLDRVAGFRDLLVETRNRAFDQSLSLERSNDRAVASLLRDMEKVGTLAADLLRLREEFERARRNSVLATVGVVIAASQIPTFINELVDWITSRNWLALGLSGFFVLLSLSALPSVWRREKLAAGEGEQSDNIRRERASNKWEMD
jgi:hypothetical protein